MFLSALNEPWSEGATLQEVIQACEDSVDESNFEIVIDPVLGDNEMKVISDSIWKQWLPSLYYIKFKTELKDAFAGFEYAKKNKEAAEAQRAAALIQSQREIEQKNNTNNLFAENAQVYSTTFSRPTKKVKTVFILK